MDRGIVKRSARLQELGELGHGSIEWVMVVVIMSMVWGDDGRHRGGRGVEVDHSRFLESVFLVLARYDALAGGTDRGGGFQGVSNP